MKFLIQIILILQTSQSLAVYFKLSDYKSGGSVQSIDISGNYVYTARDDGLFEIINITDPENPQFTASIQLSENIPAIQGRIVVSDTLAFIIGHSNIHVINISDPFTPNYEAIWNIYFSKDIVISGDLAYVATGPYFKIYDISDIQSPIELSSMYGKLDGICLNDSVVYGIHSSSPDNLRIIDVSDPYAPFIISKHIQLPLYNHSDIGFRSFHVFVVYGKNMWSINVSDPVNPIVKDTLRIEGQSNNIHINDNCAAINSYSSGFNIVDISDPDSLVLLGYYDTPGSCGQAVISDNIAYASDGSFGLQIVDISDNTTPWVLGSYQTFHQAQGLKIKEDHIYLADGAAGLDVIDISDISNPTLTGTFFNSIGYSDDVSIYNNNLCFSRKYPWPQVLFIDITIPSEPELLHTIDFYDILAYYDGLIPLDQNSEYVFVGTGDTLRIYDVSEFGNPLPIAEYAATGNIKDVIVENNLAYISTGENGIEIINLETINYPQLLGSYNSSGNAGQLEIDSNVLFIADGVSGVQLVDVSHPNTPNLIDSIKPYSNSNIITNPIIIINEMIIVDKEWNEIFTYNIADLSNIQLIESLKINAEIYRMIYSSDLFFCSVNYYGMIILNSSPILSIDDNYCNDNGDDITIFPNPFNSETIIEYHLTERSFVSIEIFNQTGMKIRSLVNGFKNTGTHHIKWNGTNNGLGRVSSGSYFARILRGNKTDTRKIIFMK